jgi:2-amino-4-hydroxy-6-hydroxymethyldihydropteridine diphosphokinase
MVIFGLGSNLGDRLAQFKIAISHLAELAQELKFSRVFESPALLMDGSPQEWNRPFYNMAVAGSTALEPLALLAEVKRIEKVMGRIDRGRWAPREIDIDILAMGEGVVDEAELCIPHPALLARDFALIPLADVAAHWHYPVAGPYFQFLPGAIIEDKGYGLGENLRDTGLSVA